MNTYKDKPLYLIVGKSASGKDTFADAACQRFGLTKVLTYTNRPKRGYKEDTHLFVDAQWFKDHEKDLVASLEYDGFMYGVTEELINAGDCIILDPKGVQNVIDSVDRKCIVIEMNLPIADRAQRLQARSEEKYDGYKEDEIIQRLLADYLLFGADFCTRVYSNAQCYRVSSGYKLNRKEVESLDQWLEKYAENVAEITS